MCAKRESVCGVNVLDTIYFNVKHLTFLRIIKNDRFFFIELNTYFRCLCKSSKSYEINSNGLQTVSVHPRKGSN